MRWKRCGGIWLVVGFWVFLFFFFLLTHRSDVAYICTINSAQPLPHRRRGAASRRIKRCETLPDSGKQVVAQV